jgi:hypothetical protein
MQVQGILKKKYATETYGANNFAKRNIVIQTIEQYPQNFLLELHQDNVDLIDQYSEGTALSVDFNLRGKEWNNPEGKEVYFNTLAVWKIEQIQTS